jgi:hypothetical protein
MKNLLRLSLILAVTFFTAYITYAAEEVVKWEQLPNLGPFGYAFSSETAKPSIAADDFECIGGEPVVAVRWWGSFYEPVPAAHFYPNSAQWNDPTTPSDIPEAMLIGFNVSFYKSVTAGTDPFMPWAHPGDLIYNSVIGMADLTQSLYGTVTHTSGVEQNVWEYYASLPETGFEQEEGLTYWISIQAVHRDQEVQWGWQEALQPGWNADMVQQGYSPYPQLIVWDLVPNKELAFQLITQEGDIPEPASMLLLAFGVFGLFLRKRVR